MREVRAAAFAALGMGVLIGCSTFHDQSRAMVGGGAVAGQDYINGLTPSEKSRMYFAQNIFDEAKVMTISRRDGGVNAVGVRFVANGGVVIPPGASIIFENEGYCCDPHLPAPNVGDEYQFVKTGQLVPEEIQPIYRKLLTKASSGDEATLRSMQKLVWALRTAGTEAGYSNNLTDQEKRILNSCSEYEGEFELYCAEKLATGRLWKWLLARVDSRVNITVGGVSYKASDLLNDTAGEKKIKAHLGQLITLGERMPVEHNGFNYGEIADGIYTDIKGVGPLKFKAMIANSTSQPFTFYPMDYVAQVGSDVSGEAASVVYYATKSTMQKQRVTVMPQDDFGAAKVEIVNYCDDSKSRSFHGGESVTLSYDGQTILLPNGDLFRFSGGDVRVDIRKARSFWGRFCNGFGSFPSNAGAFTKPDDWFFGNTIFIFDSTDEEVRHEGIHILTRTNDELSKYKGTKNEEYLAYMISEKGKRSPQAVKEHIDKDEAYKSKAWIPWK